MKGIDVALGIDSKEIGAIRDRYGRGVRFFDAVADVPKEIENVSGLLIGFCRQQAEKESLNSKCKRNAGTFC